MKKYINPEIEITLFENTDVITASPNLDKPIETPDDVFDF